MRLPLAAILIVQMALMPVGFALKVQIDEDVKLREFKDSQQERIGLLKRGTVFEIPDEFVVQGRDGKPNLELTLNNWLKTGGRRSGNEHGAGLYRFDGEKNDYFFPVKVIREGLAESSTVPDAAYSQPTYVALKYLIRRGTLLSLTNDSEIRTQTPRQKAEASPQGIAAREEQQRALEAQSPCAQGLCSAPSDTSDSVRSLIRAITPALGAAERRSKQVFQRTSNDARKIENTFRQSCGFSVGEFANLVKSRGEQAGVPGEVLLSLMTQESSGRCFALNSEADNTQSVGLFQIKSSGARFPRCTTEQKNILRNIGSPQRLSTGPRCLENPLLNLDEALRLLKSKKAAIIRGGFDESQMSELDMWRLAVSGYNGGEKWVLEAKRDLEKFNSINGTNLNANNWEDLSLFYFRSWLDPQKRRTMLGETREGRSQSNSVANLSYAENIIGRSVSDRFRPSQTTQWTAALRGNRDDE